MIGGYQACSTLFIYLPRNTKLKDGCVLLYMSDVGEVVKNLRPFIEVIDDIM